MQHIVFSSFSQYLNDKDYLICFLAQRSFLLNTSSATEHALSSDDKVYDRLFKYFDKRLAMNTEKMEKLVKDNATMMNQIAELTQQIACLQQRPAGV